MKLLKYALLAITASVLFAIPAKKADAQISIGIGIGEPACPYGYYGYAPYRCAPYGYYGPEWFNGGRFIGAGRWYHGGGQRFYGNVNRSYDPRYGYHGGFPNRGEGFHEPQDHWQGFHGTHRADPRGSYHGRAGGDDHGHR